MDLGVFGRNDEAEPDTGVLEAGQPGRRKARHARQRGHGVERRDAERPQLAALDQRERRRQRCEAEVDLSADHRGDLLGRAFERDVRDAAAGRQEVLEQHTGQMLRGAVAGRAVVQAAGRGGGLQIGHGLDRAGGGHHEHVGRRAERDHGREVFQRVVAEVRVQRTVDWRSWRSSRAPACSRRASNAPPSPCPGCRLPRGGSARRCSA